MNRKAEIQNAYKYLGKESTFYDGMITCSTIPGTAATLYKRLSSLYEEVNLETVESMACFTCKKGEKR